MNSVTTLLFAATIASSDGFIPGRYGRDVQVVRRWRSVAHVGKNTDSSGWRRWSMLQSTAQDQEQETATEISSTRDSPINGDEAPVGADGENKDVEGLPIWWEWVWKLKFMSNRGEPGTDLNFADTAYVFKTNIEQIYGGYPSLDGCPVAEGEIADIQSGTQFIGLQRYQRQFGSPYKLCFGPKSFLVISDPVQARHILKENNKLYDKGILAEILEPIMGKGLIPADPETWSVRRRQVVPAFHKAWLDHMVGLFAYCNQPLISSLRKISAKANPQVEMEERFCSVALDIIGKSVFNYEFGSVDSESPVVKAVYSALVEAEHRSMTPAPYWNIPLANRVVPRLRRFNSNLRLLNNVLDQLINLAKSTRVVEDIEELEKRNYAEVQDPSLLRFLVDMKGADIDNKQLRDDLMTMLIAGHETTAAVLTWALFELVKNPAVMATAREEIDRVLGDRDPTVDDITELRFLRLIVAETLRMYPEPPLLIRRCREEDHLPAGAVGREATVIRGMDMFLSLYNIHRDERYWPNPDTFDPSRWERPYSNPDCPEWNGYDPSRWKGQLYPTEPSADFAYLPFGGGPRKCIGDMFATLEATVTLAMVLRRFEFEFDPSANSEASVGVMDPPQSLDHPVGMRTGATIHTRQGLNLLVKERKV